MQKQHHYEQNHQTELPFVAAVTKEPSEKKKGMQLCFFLLYRHKMFRNLYLLYLMFLQILLSPLFLGLNIYDYFTGQQGEDSVDP
jgi:hypothetical protein